MYIFMNQLMKYKYQNEIQTHKQCTERIADAATSGQRSKHSAVKHSFD